MKLSRLKKIRVGVSVVFLTLIGLLFVDFQNLVPPSLREGLLYLQFVPSLLAFLTAAGLGAAGFIIVLAVTALFGRVYCSAVCPLGILQDAINFLTRKIRKRRRFQFTKPHNVLRYSLLCLTVLALLVGGGFLLNLLDPFSAFGRIFSNLVRPVFLAANNGAASVLEPLGVTTLYRVRWAVIAPASAVVAAATLVLVGWLAVKHGRLYCNTVCPVGALLGLVSRVSLFRISVDQDACKGCKRCERACKANCIDIENQAIDFSRCVACYNCLAVCPTNGLLFQRAKRPSPPEAGPDKERREFIVNSGLFAVGLTGLGEPVKKIIQSKPTTVPALLTNPVSPPGSGSIAHFTSTCTACHLCVSACPSRVLVPSFLEYGFLGLMQPRLNFQTGHCNYECTLCTEVCPSGALLPLTTEKKKQTQLGAAKFIKENCVVHTDKTNCGACSEHCPTKAVDMVPYPNPANKKLVIPKVNPDLCVGCGGCEHACPTKPYKAIYVHGHPVHKTARKPVLEKLEEKVDYKEDFPF